MGDAANLLTELAPLWRSVHDRLSSGLPVSRVRVGPLDPAQRSALADLLGQDRLPGEHATMSLPLLDQVLTDSVGLTAREVVEQLLGPVGDRAGQRARAEAAKTGLWTWLAAHPVVAAQPALAAWADSLRRAGLPDNSVTTARELLTKVLSVLAELPAPGIPLPVLADRLLDDPHGLDDGTRCATLVQRALAAIYDVAPPENAQQRRALWDLAGVADDHLSSVVLAAGLRPTGDDLGQPLCGSARRPATPPRSPSATCERATWPTGSPARSGSSRIPRSWPSPWPGSAAAARRSWSPPAGRTARSSPCSASSPQPALHCATRTRGGKLLADLTPHLDR